MAYLLKQKNKRGGVDIYYTTNHRVPGKAYPVQTRKYLGQLDPQGQEIIKNKKLSNFTAEELEALEKNGIEFNGREAAPPGRKPASVRKVGVDALRHWRSLEFGRVSVMRTLAEESGLLPALSEAFGEKGALEIFAVALFECVENSAVYRLENWIDETILAERDVALSKSSVGRLIAETGSDEAAASVFFQEWIKALGYPKALVHDTTSISSYAEKMSLIEYGYNRDRERLPQLNFGLVYTVREQLPLLYRVIPGSIPDVSTLKGTSRLLMEYGLRRFTYALDRGYYSKSNLLAMLAEKLQFTIGAPLYVSDIKKILGRHRSELEKIESGLLVDGKSYRYAKDILLLKEDGKRGRSHKLGVHIFMNRQRRSQSLHELDTMLLSIQEQFEREVFNSKAEAVEWCEEKFQVKSDLYEISGRRGGRFRLKISEKAYEEKTRNLGVFVILNSDPKADALATLRANRDRDAVEKLFDILKNATPNRRPHSASDHKAKGRMFIGFIAVILHALMENKLRKHGLLNSTTVNQAFDLLRKIRVAISSSGQRTLQEIPGKSRKLLEKLNLTLPKV